MSLAKQYAMGQWVKGEELSDDEPLVVTIKAAYEHTFNDGTQRLCLMFVDHPQDMRLNVTQVKRMMGLFGDNEQQWVGKTIELSPLPTQVGTSIAIRKARVQDPAEVEFK